MQINGVKMPSKTVQGTISEGGKVVFESIDIEVFSSAAPNLSEHTGLRGTFLLPAHKFLVPGFYDLNLKAGAAYRIVVKELRAKGRKDIYAMFGEVSEARELSQAKGMQEPQKTRHAEKRGAR